jgi:2-phospho-L-lactate guanylyltransferase
VSLALVPVKALAASKSRLLPELDREQLQQLSLAMLQDVVEALCRVESLDRVVVATPDAAVAKAACAAGADALLRPDAGLNQAIDAAAADLLTPGEPFLVVLGDVAGARSAEIELLFEGAAELRAPCAALAPSRDGGTSALLRIPWNAIPSRFGRDSAKAHRNAASEAGIAYREIALPSLAIDLDRAEDVALFLASYGGDAPASGDSGGARTRALLHSLGWQRGERAT